MGSSGVHLAGSANRGYLQKTDKGVVSAPGIPDGVPDVSSINRSGGVSTEAQSIAKA